ncbi:MAG: glycosyltransferase family 4 protein [bacterium]|nr:glycosyltransferase family 4 protein [bacterium]
MNICIFTRTTLAHSIGGMEVHADLLAKGLIAKGHEVSIITTCHKEGKEQEIIDNMHLYYVAGSKPGRSSNKWFRLSEKKFLSLHLKRPFDIVFSESGGAFRLLRHNINKRCGIPIILIMHGMFYNEIKTRLNVGLNVRSLAAVAYYILIYLIRDVWLISRANAVIATSHEQKRLIKKYYFLPESKVFTIFNGVETKISPVDTALKKKIGFADSDKILLSVARLKREKGLHVILQALPEILVNVPQAKLLIVGDGEYRSYLENLASELGLMGKVIFTGAIPYEDLGKYFHLADVFVNSTIRENGYDLTIIQGMAYGKPVVVSRLKSLIGVIADGQNGFLVKMGDVTAFAQTVTKVLKDISLATKIGKEAQQQACTLFGVENMVENTNEVLEHVYTQNKT